MLRNSQTGYGTLAILFHWAMAILMIGMLGLGIYMHELPQTETRTYELYQLHKSFGFVILGLAVLRILWRFSNPAPALPQTMKPWEKMASALGHFGLYAVLLILPISGWLMVSASPWGIPTILFETWKIPHLPIPSVLGTKQDAADFFQTIHELTAYLTVGLIVGHISAALKHHFINKDAVLRRMVTSAEARKALP